MKYNIKILIGIIALFFCLFIFEGCNEATPEDDSSDHSRIVPGFSIDGVKFGDSPEVATSILGVSNLGGVVDGLYRSWTEGMYTEGKHAGLDIYCIETNNNIGPLDMLIIHSPYDGKTRYGIGIGSNFSDVSKAYGFPDRIIRNDTSKHYFLAGYCFGRKFVNIGFKDSLITGITMGYYFPIPEDKTNTCK
jgi:hypothetical protein